MVEVGKYNRSLGLLKSMDLQDMDLQDSMDLQDIYADYMSLYIHLETPLHLCTFSYILHSSEVEIEIDDNTKTITPYLNISMQTPGKPCNPLFLSFQMVKFSIQYLHYRGRSYTIMLPWACILKIIFPILYWAAYVLGDCLCIIRRFTYSIPFFLISPESRRCLSYRKNRFNTG